MNFKDTELTLRLPGDDSVTKCSTKRGFSDTVDLDELSPTNEPYSSHETTHEADELEAREALPATKAQVVGWPPVRSLRKKVLGRCKYVKVGADGAPFLRKVDLELYNSYQELLRALQDLFTSFSIFCVGEENNKLVKPALKGIEYVPTYEDKDGDLMLVGDVPWKMFKESCKRIRLMKSSEAVGLANRPTPQNMNKSCKVKVNLNN
ncbi:hypothetical protein UlMin_022313 [Ulmus minor]